MIVLDTHVLLWLALAPERVSPAAEAALESDQDRAISVITAQEVAYLVARGRVDLYRPVRSWLQDALTAFGARALPVSVAGAVRAGSLDPQSFHGDPFDRLIYATAIEHDAPLLSADKRLRDADPHRVVW